MTSWSFKGSHDDWDRMHSIFGDCAIVVYDRAAKAEAAEQAEIIAELKILAVAYFNTVMQRPKADPSPAGR